MAIDLTETDDDSEAQAGYNPDLDQHSLPETTDSAPGSGTVTPTASLQLARAATIVLGVDVGT